MLMNYQVADSGLMVEERKGLKIWGLESHDLCERERLSNLIVLTSLIAELYLG